MSAEHESLCSFAEPTAGPSFRFASAQALATALDRILPLAWAAYAVVDGDTWWADGLTDRDLDDLRRVTDAMAELLAGATKE